MSKLGVFDVTLFVGTNTLTENWDSCFILKTPKYRISVLTSNKILNAGFKVYSR